jgi:SAM-dependent methyltransferase/esterase/lipase
MTLIQDQPSPFDRRTHPRITATLPVRIKLVSTAVSQYMEGHTVNISKGGAAVISERPLQKGKYISLTIHSSTDIKELEFLAEIMWCNALLERECYQFGVKFLETYNENMRILEQIIEEKTILEPEKSSRLTVITPKIVSEPIKYKNRFGKSIIGMYDHYQSATFRQPFIIIPPAHGETKRNSIMLGYYLAKNNFNVIRYDNTNHLGESDGEIYYTTLDMVKEDIMATLDYIQKQFGVNDIGIVVPSLTARVAFRVAKEDRRIKFLLSLMGVVNVRYTLNAVYQEDIIDMLLKGEDENRESFNILGFESNREYPLSAIRNNLHTLEGTIEDINSIKAPVVFIAAENDAWIDITDVKSIFQRASAYPRELFIVPMAMHQFYENPGIVKEVLCNVVSYTIKYMCNEKVSIQEIEEPDLRTVAYQNRIEKERLKRYELTTEEEKQFWSKYLYKYIVVNKSPDYKEYLNTITKTLLSYREEKKILDAGCGPGHLGLWLLGKLGCINNKSLYHYVGVDFAESALCDAKRDFLKIRENIIDGQAPIPQFIHSYIVFDLDMKTDTDWHEKSENGSVLCFKDSTFDAVCCSLLVSYLKNPQGALKELFRVLKPGGKILVSSLKPYADLSIAFKRMIAEMNSKEEIEEARILLNSIGLIKEKEGEGHYQFFSEEELVRLVSRAGGEIVQSFKAFTNQINVVVAVK